MTVLAVIATILTGYVTSALFDEWMNWPQAGPIFAVAVMGAFILHALKKDHRK